jgi:hypothetical protein
MINLTKDSIVLTSVNILLIYFVLKVIYTLWILIHEPKRIFKHFEFFSEHLAPNKIIKNYSDELNFYKNLNREDQKKYFKMSKDDKIKQYFS